MDGNEKQVRELRAAVHEALNEARIKEARARKAEDLAMQIYNVKMAEAIEATRCVWNLEDKYKQIKKKKIASFMD